MRYVCCHYLGLPERVWEIMSTAWEPATRKAYEGPARRWMEYTQEHNIPPTTPSVSQVLQFLTVYYDTGVGYSSIVLQKAFMSFFIKLDNAPLGKHPLVAKFVKGTKKARTVKPDKLSYIWDPVPVLKHLETWGPIQDLKYEQLTKRTMALFLLATGQRLQALSLLKRADFIWTEHSVRIKYTDRMKSNDPIDNPLILRFTPYMNECICVFAHLKAYMAHPLSQVAVPYTFSTIKPPTTKAKPVTISNYVKSALNMAGVDGQFSAYSARSASTSAAARLNIPVCQILTSAGWASESTFARFYNRPLHVPQEIVDTNFIPAMRAE